MVRDPPVVCLLKHSIMYVHLSYFHYLFDPLLFIWSIVHTLLLALINHERKFCFMRCIFICIFPCRIVQKLDLSKSRASVLTSVRYILNSSCDFCCTLEAILLYLPIIVFILLLCLCIGNHNCRKLVIFLGQ